MCVRVCVCVYMRACVCSCVGVHACVSLSVCVHCVYHVFVLFVLSVLPCYVTIKLRQEAVRAGRGGLQNGWSSPRLSSDTKYCDCRQSECPDVLLFGVTLQLLGKGGGKGTPGTPPLGSCRELQGPHRSLSASWAGMSQGPQGSPHWRGTP
jgi:hypothetical protein